LHLTLTERRKYILEKNMKSFFFSSLVCIHSLAVIHFAFGHGENGSLPHCDELSDDLTATIVINDDFEVNACEWAGKKDTSWRCYNNNEVDHACPITCGHECVTESPTSPPSSAPSATKICDDRTDSTERFYVEELGLNKDCDWAKAKDTPYRCRNTAVMWNCQVTCDLECVTLSPTSPPQPLSFAGAQEFDEGKNSFPFDIVFGSIGGALLIGAVAVAAHATRNKGELKTEKAPSEDTNVVKFDEVDDKDNEEGYAGFCGFGSTAETKSKEAKPLTPEKDDEVSHTTTYYVSEKQQREQKTKKTYNWAYRQY